MSAEILSVLNVIVFPILGGIVTWMWKLDQRVFDIRSGVLTREEFVEEMRALRAEIAELRRAVKP